MTTKKTFTKMIAAASLAVVIALASISFSAKATQDTSVQFCWGTYHVSPGGIELCDGAGYNCTHPCAVVQPTTPIIVAEN